MHLCICVYCTYLCERICVKMVWFISCTRTLNAWLVPILFWVSGFPVSIFLKGGEGEELGLTVSTNFEVVVKSILSSSFPFVDFSPFFFPFLFLGFIYYFLLSFENKCYGWCISLSEASRMQTRKRHSKTRLYVEECLREVQ